MTENSCCDSHVTLGARSLAPRLPVMHARVVSRCAAKCVARTVRAIGVLSWLGHDPMSQVILASPEPRNFAFSVQFWTIQPVSNIFTLDPKILGLNI